MIGKADVLYFFAAGLSALAAENALLRFARIGKPAIFHRDRNNQLLIAGSMHPGSLAIAISDSGRTNQTVMALTAARQAGAATIALTAFAESPLARQAVFALVPPLGLIFLAVAVLYVPLIWPF